MQLFGWNLQSRQVIREEGDAEGSPDVIGSGYTIKEKVSQYVKLHFVRGLDLPNLNKIKQLESEYFNVPFSPLPSFKWAIIGFIVFLIFILLTLSTSGPVWVGIADIALKGLWYWDL